MSSEKKEGFSGSARVMILFFCGGLFIVLTFLFNAYFLEPVSLGSQSSIYALVEGICFLLFFLSFFSVLWFLFWFFLNSE